MCVSAFERVLEQTAMLPFRRRHVFIIIFIVTMYNSHQMFAHYLQKQIRQIKKSRNLRRFFAIQKSHVSIKVVRDERVEDLFVCDHAIRRQLHELCISGADLFYVV